MLHYSIARPKIVLESIPKPNDVSLESQMKESMDITRTHMKQSLQTTPKRCTVIPNALIVQQARETVYLEVTGRLVFAFEAAVSTALPSFSFRILRR